MEQLPNPWTIGDGGIPWSVAVDPSCPSFEIAGFVTVTTPSVHGLAEIETAVGCCLPSGVCGGAPPVERVTVDSNFPIASFAGWAPPDKCLPYSSLDQAPTRPANSCHYPFEARTVPSDATTVGDGGDGCVPKKVAVTATHPNGSCLLSVPPGADLAVPLVLDARAIGLPYSFALSQTTGPCDSTNMGWEQVSADTIEICGQACDVFGSLPFTFTLKCNQVGDASTDAASRD